jgi:catechol-2,3-dioxygenase|tara:strand:+ start:409 stop:888 length:480 start_codon:yes stop_codon:yes gene_type:complete
MPQTSGLGHVGIYVNDIHKMREFYTKVIGLKIGDEDLDGRGICFLSSDPVAEHHEFVLMKGRSSDQDTQLIQQMSFKVSSIQDLREFKQIIEDEQLRIDRIVSHGNAFGMYFFDPEGNRVELYYRTGFPVPQPHGDPLDLSRSDEELISDARELLYSKR